MSQKTTDAYRTIWDEHEAVDSSSSPFVNYFENYYLAHPKGWASAVASAQWIPKAARDHIMEHLVLRFKQRTRERRRTKRITFEEFIQNDSVHKASSKRIQYQKDSRGISQKRSKSSGMYLPWSKEEKMTIRKHKGVKSR